MTTPASTDRRDLAAEVAAAIDAEIRLVDTMAGGLAEAIDDRGEPGALNAARAFLADLDRDRLEKIACFALLVLARNKGVHRS